MPAHLSAVGGYHLAKCGYHAAPHVAKAAIHIAKAAVPPVTQATVQVLLQMKDGSMSFVSVVMVPLVTAFVSELGKDAAKSVVTGRRKIDHASKRVHE